MIIVVIIIIVIVVVIIIFIFMVNLCRCARRCPSRWRRRSASRCRPTRDLFLIDSKKNQLHICSHLYAQLQLTFEASDVKATFRITILTRIMNTVLKKFSVNIKATFQITLVRTISRIVGTLVVQVAKKKIVNISLPKLQK